MRRLSRFALLMFSAVLLTAIPASAGYKLTGWAVDKVQPDLEYGGRANTIAVDPTDSNTIIVSTPSGGLFTSSTRGASWSHIDSLPASGTNGLTFLTAVPKTVIATTGEDFKTSNGGGIWRSADGGSTWVQAMSPPAPSGVKDRFGAGEISVAADTGAIYVATVYGVSISGDNGLSWSPADPFGGSQRRAASVLARRGNLVLAGGPAGIRRSTNGGTNWFPPAAGPGSVTDMHALGGSPYVDDQAYVVNDNTELYYTEDGGDHWTKIASAPGGGAGAGGIAFVKAIGKGAGVDLYFGNRYELWKLSCPAITGTKKLDYGGSWVKLKIDHVDTRDLAFDSAGQPLLLATDGGLHNTADGGLNWKLVGGGPKGFNALQITEVKGQWITDIGRHDLYFGTQDNNLYASGDDGKTWGNPICCEGFFIEGQHRVATAADSRITFTACSGCSNLISGPLFSGVAGWPNATTPPAGSPAIVRKSFHVQGVNAAASFTKGLAVTMSLGTAWKQYATLPEDRRDLPKLSDPGLHPVLYQSIRTGYDAAREMDIHRLARIVEKASGPGASVSYPTMNNFGGMGINPTMFAWYQVFGVDPGNASHVIAPDVVNEKMMETWDGGDNWTEIPQLTSLVTDGGKFAFRLKIFPHASAVSFSPDDPNVVAVTTWENGLFLSADRGATWSKVPYSDRIPRITSVTWRTAYEAFVSSYGRGLWRVSWKLLKQLPDFKKACRVRCDILPFPPLGDPAREKAKYAVLVYGGHIQGAQVAGGALKELFVFPGSSVVFFSDEEGMKVKVTETIRQVGFSGVKAPTPRKPRAIMVGLTLGDRGNLVGAAFADKALPMSTVSEQELREPPLHEKSPTAGKPYLHLATSASGAANFIAPEKPLEIAGRGFRAGTSVDIAIDGRVVEKVRVGDSGAFSLAVTAPREAGLHTVTARDPASGTAIDGATFLVRSEDRRPE